MRLGAVIHVNKALSLRLLRLKAVQQGELIASAVPDSASATLCTPDTASDAVTVSVTSGGPASVAVAGETESATVGSGAGATYTRIVSEPPI